MRQLAIALVLLLGLAGCATTQPGAPGPASASTAPTETSARGCPALVGVTVDDAGATRCVALRGTVVVFLTHEWAPPQLSAPGILYAVPDTDSPGPAMVSYVAVGIGSVDITSSRTACPSPSPGSAGCHAQQGWRITVTVR